MSDFHVLIPKLGESIQEATVTKLFVKQGDTIVEDDLLFEVATDKVDSEIPSPVAGIIKEIRCAEGDIIPVGQIVMIISMGNEAVSVPEVPDKPLIPDTSPETPTPVVVIHPPVVPIDKNELNESGRLLVVVAVHETVMAVVVGYEGVCRSGGPARLLLPDEIEGFAYAAELVKGEDLAVEGRALAARVLARLEPGHGPVVEMQGPGLVAQGLETQAYAHEDVGDGPVRGHAGALELLDEFFRDVLVVRAVEPDLDHEVRRRGHDLGHGGAATGG